MSANERHVTIVGGGLAGCEAAFQLAERGIRVTLLEQKPTRRTPAQHGDGLAELVCSNSMRGAALTNAVGLLKEELRRVGSIALACADEAKVPAGGALAVDRDIFSNLMTERVKRHPLITVKSEVVLSIPEATELSPVIIATGPLTGDELAADLASKIGQQLAYYDAIAPIIAADSIKWENVFRQSRWGKGEVGTGGEGEAAEEGTAASLGDQAYVNCPLSKEQYDAFIAALLAADKVAPREFEDVRYFEGCLPIEVMAERGPQTLSFGPMKPVGLTDPKTGRRPFAVVQLRQEDHAATAYNLVGFQTRMTYGAQKAIFSMIPGLEECEILRYGTVHRNTFVDAPKVLDEHMMLRALPNVYLAGQIAGVEGYVESAAGGYLASLFVAERLLGKGFSAPPENTALGGLLTHLSRTTDRFQPSNITWACLPPHENRKLKKQDRYAALSARALVSLEAWLDATPFATMRPRPRRDVPPAEVALSPS